MDDRIKQTGVETRTAEAARKNSAVARVLRWVVVVPDKSRTADYTLFDKCWGQYTYATRREASDRANAFKAGSGIAGLRIAAVECWPGHFDPCGVWFDADETREPLETQEETVTQ